MEAKDKQRNRSKQAKITSEPGKKQEQTSSAIKPDNQPDNAERLESLIMDYPTSIEVAGFFKSFSDSTRLRILEALSIYELCVSDICRLLELSQPTVSNHLRILNNQHIVKYRREGKNIYYSIDDWHINGIIGMAREHLKRGDTTI